MAGIYLLTDAIITAADTDIGSRAVYSLAASASSTGDTTVTIPASLAPGTYYIGAYADKSAIQPETNNRLTGTALVVAATPNAPVIGTPPLAARPKPLPVLPPQSARSS